MDFFMYRKGLKRNRFFIFMISLSLILFIPLFVIREIDGFDFWWWMSSNLVFLVLLGYTFDRSFQKELNHDLRSKIIKKTGAGILSAAVLYGIFYVGNVLVRYLFDFAGEDISNVYGFKGQAEEIRIGLLMLFIIGPGEELLWRGYIQGTFSAALGKYKGYILGVILYTLIHVATGNLILIAAALVGGLFWGWMYMKYNSLLMNMVSHIAWDIVIFLVFPLNG